tara:strand:- start:771 stop:1016 length:246 start_codon:yes stop_codon:yes gene_type:complete
MKNFSALLIAVLLCPIGVQAGISSKTEANKFLDQYCIALVETIKESYESQLSAVKTKDWKTFGEKGRWIHGVSEVYSNLCK